MFVESARGNIPMDAVVDEARGALQAMNQRKMQAYREGLQGAFAGAAEGPLKFGDIEKSINTVLDQGAFKGVDISRSTATMRDNIRGVVEQWKALDPAEFHGVEGLDAMRKALGDYVDSAPFGSPERRMANQAYFAVRQAIEKQAPGYGKVMRGYHEATNHLRDLERALSLGKTAATETALRKLQAVMRNDVTSAFGKRGEYARELADAGAGNLDVQLAGQALNPWTPRALASRIGGLGAGGAAVGGLVSPMALPLVAGASPRIVGAGAYRLGQATAPLADALRTLPAGAGQAAFQSGRLAGVQP